MSICAALNLIPPASQLSDSRNLRMAFPIFASLYQVFADGVTELVLQNSLRGTLHVPSRGTCRELIEEMIRFGIITRHTFVRNSTLHLTPLGIKIARELVSQHHKKGDAP